MINYKNIQRFDDIQFQDYLKIPGYSQSFLKREFNGILPGMEVTENMKFGSMVDAILTQPDEVDLKSHLYNPARAVALEIKKFFPELVEKAQKQVNFIADMTYKHNGFTYTMPTKARLDYLVMCKRRKVIDLKITKSKDIPGLIKFMRYEDQLWHYARISESEQAYLLIYSLPLKKPFLFNIPITEENIFWQGKIIDFGKC